MKGSPENIDLSLSGLCDFDGSWKSLFRRRSVDIGWRRIGLCFRDAIMLKQIIANFYIVFRKRFLRQPITFLDAA